MRLIHPAFIRGMRTNALALALAMLVVGGTAVVLMALLPENRPAAMALLGISAALGLGVGAVMVWREVGAEYNRLFGQVVADVRVPVTTMRLAAVHA